jgi:hypothetical protein
LFCVLKWLDFFLCMQARLLIFWQCLILKVVNLNFTVSIWGRGKVLTECKREPWCCCSLVIRHTVSQVWTCTRWKYSNNFFKYAVFQIFCHKSNVSFKFSVYRMLRHCVM